MSSRGIIDLRNGRSNQPRRLAPHVPGGLRDRRSPLRAKRRRTRALLALFVLVLIAAAAYGIHWVSFEPRFIINTISVRGVKYLSEESVRSTVHAQLSDDAFRFIALNNIFTYPRDTIERALEDSFPRISSAALSRSSLLSTELTVDIIEREAFARWCRPTQVDTAADCFVLDQGGFIFTSADSNPVAPSTPYIFYGGIMDSSPIGTRYEAGQLPGILAFLKLLQEGGFVPLGARITDEHDYAVPLERGFFVKASYGGNPDVLVRNLELIVSSDTLRGKENELEYIDLRFGNRVYYKMKGAAEVRAE